MPTLEDVRRIALTMPGAIERVDGHRGDATWRVSAGPFVWERGPSKADAAALAELGREWPGGETIAVRTESLEDKDALLAADPGVFFTIPHFDGYPAVLVLLDAVDEQRLIEIVTDAWLARAPKRARDAWLAEHPPESTA